MHNLRKVIFRTTGSSPLNGIQWPTRSRWTGPPVDYVSIFGGPHCRGAYQFKIVPSEPLTRRHLFVKSSNGWPEHHIYTNVGDYPLTIFRINDLNNRRFTD
jgi:hypothetical protein